eukprot:CAMPEP_0168540992 /NCGR_PEP_ID=MMETSP0413-20121227/580_1 /TAXON_ID=136452 /ORGANISM="Filamoeba nolandi, Strain NC-AS-23-1" /LENGTH=361 /DNA_ID=CAMNT_0008570779 /DNA_START=1 /DNA_END=1086 /DNA_ORIENTATION=+
MGDVALVIGGCGFLGSFIVEVLLSEIQKQRSSVGKIIAVDVRTKETVFDDPQIENLRQKIVTYKTIDIRNAGAVDEICHGIDTVFHCASLVEVGTCVNKKLLHDINVLGAQNVISACLKNRVSRLIYISTQDVVIDCQDRYHQQESISYPSDLIYGEYARTKQIAEKCILSANGSFHKQSNSRLATCSVRPVVMYGERDPHNLPNVFGAAKHFPLVRFGSRDSRVNFAYVGNVAYGAVLANEELRKDSKKVGGEVFTITDDTPVNNFFDILKPFVEAKGRKVSSFNIHWSIMFFMAFVVEFVTSLLQPFITIRIPFCKGVVQGMCYKHVFNSKRAEELLGYKPPFDYPTAFKRTMNYWKDK